MTEAERDAVGVVTATAQSLISSLPAQFLVLVLMNTAFLVGILWFLNNLENRRERTWGPVIAGCMQAVPPDLVKEMIAALKTTKG